MGLAAADAGTIELRPWVYTAARVEGGMLLVWPLAVAGRSAEG